jgi:hypothetical protein
MGIATLALTLEIALPSFENTESVEEITFSAENFQPKVYQKAITELYTKYDNPSRQRAVLEGFHSARRQKDIDDLLDVTESVGRKSCVSRFKVVELLESRNLDSLKSDLRTFLKKVESEVCFMSSMLASFQSSSLLCGLLGGIAVVAAVAGAGCARGLPSAKLGPARRRGGGRRRSSGARHSRHPGTWPPRRFWGGGGRW